MNNFLIEIKSAITEFINVIEKPKETVAEREKALVIALDKLILFKNFAPDVFDKADYPESPELEMSGIWEKIANLFPDFGYYNLPTDVSINVGETEWLVGHAYDDICDIYKDLKDIQWRFENTSENDALWYFGNMVSWHWLQHALFLRLYIFSKEYGF